MEVSGAREGEDVGSAGQSHALKLLGGSERGRAIFYSKVPWSRSQWPRGLRRRSAAVRLLKLWVRIPPGAWMTVMSVVCCQVEVSATS